MASAWEQFAAMGATANQTPLSERARHLPVPPQDGVAHQALQAATCCAELDLNKPRHRPTGEMLAPLPGIAERR